jgi:hypothetical protein
MVNFSGTPTSELLPELKEFPEPRLDLTSDSVPVEDPTKSKYLFLSEEVLSPLVCAVWDIQIKKFIAFMEPEFSLPCSQQLNT